MAAPALATLNPYIPWNNRTHDWVPTIANIAAPSRAEIDAGNDLSGQLIEAPGWSVSSATVQSQSFRGAALNLTGLQTIAESTLVMRLSRTATDARSILLIQSPPLAGYIIVFPEGDVSGYKMDVFSVQVLGAPRSDALGDPAVATFQFAVNDYRLRVTVP